MLYKQYNELDKDSKELFSQAHAPNKMRVGESLVRRYRALYNGHLKAWTMPTSLELNHYNPVVDSLTGEESKVYKNFRYMAFNRNSLHWIEEQKKAGEKLGDNRGQYKDMNGVVHKDVYKQGNFFFKIVTDLNEEIEFLSTLFIKAEVPKVAVVEKQEPKKEVKEVEVSADSKEIYTKWVEDDRKSSKKEFAKANGISTHILNKIIKENEL